ncbi:carbohydrate ABC transporter substrate-binding protein, CUT1 family (TC 3.A.1.1.-) [Gracilibacillus orientalis]|uniref:Carbohydrate ABC transporter substrate-binding protein, CUT1 family (TC 3.A.1.1.-) n=1 Tax=Gracilibacillus orientalis TaxID=334253 RepID=A0A1I4J197_9BACI|nr:extracellular solute-binding protein [Gracilibacillus orientalis]SFL60300.1 carbohydrate ABC transporter substrate-binding protein, CUT1 family (TC 3.A.1.1.-) [Gracilibacillus orientalis]
MRKGFSVFIGVVFVALILAACSGNSDSAGNDVEIPEGATEVVMWNLFSGGDAEYMNDIVTEFNDSQEEYFVNNVQQEYEEYYTKLLTSVGSGKGPDLAIAHSHVLPELVTQGLVTNINDYAEDAGLNWDEFNQNVLDVTVYDGNNYAVPIDTHPEIMFINNNLVDEAGLLNDDGTPDFEKTPEGFVEFLTSLKESLPEDKMPFAFSSVGEDPYRIWWALYNQMGGENIVSGDMENPTYALDHEKATKAAKYLYDLYHTHEAIPLDLADFYSDFQSGNAALITTGVWATGIWETTEDLDFTPMPFPNIFGQDAAWASSHTFVLPYYDDADEDAQKGAVEFMKFATDNGADWARAGHIPAKDTVLESDEFKDMPYRSEYAEVANYVKYVDRTVHARGIQDIVVRNLDKYWAGDAAAEEVFSMIEQEVTDLIAE